MTCYIFNVDGESPEAVVEQLRTGSWAVGAEEHFGSALAAGDLALIYIAAPHRVFVGRARLASALGVDSPGRVSLTEVERWEPPVPMASVLARIDQSAGARADFDSRVVRITESEFETANEMARPSRPRPGRD